LLAISSQLSRCRVARQTASLGSIQSTYLWSETLLRPARKPKEPPPSGGGSQTVRDL
jgi:hypothetical protein